MIVVILYYFSWWAILIFTYFYFGAQLGDSLADYTGKDMSAATVFNFIFEFICSILFCVVAWPVWLFKRPKKRRLNEQKCRINDFYKAKDTTELVKILDDNEENFSPSQYGILRNYFRNDGELGRLTDQEEHLLDLARENFNKMILKSFY